MEDLEEAVVVVALEEEATPLPLLLQDWLTPMELTTSLPEGTEKESPLQESCILAVLSSKMHG